MDDPASSALPTTHPLCRAAGLGQIVHIKAAMVRSEAFLETDEQGNTPLFHAVWSNQLPIVEMLLSKMNVSGINQFNHLQNTALHFAVARGTSHVAIIDLLIQHGADIHIKNSNGESPRDLAKKSGVFDGHKTILRLLELAHAKPNTMTQEMLDKKKQGQERRVSRPAQAANTGFYDFRTLLRGDEQFQNLSAIFELLTTNHENQNKNAIRNMGVLKAKHLKPIFDFLKMDLSNDEFKAVLSLMDVNADGSVDMEDFWKSMLVRAGTTFDAKPAFEKPFQAADKDGDGLIGEEDYRAASQQLGKMFCAETDAEVITILRHTMGLSDAKYDGIGFGKRLGIDREAFKRIAAGSTAAGSTRRTNQAVDATGSTLAPAVAIGSASMVPSSSPPLSSSTLSVPPTSTSTSSSLSLSPRITISSSSPRNSKVSRDEAGSDSQVPHLARKTTLSSSSLSHGVAGSTSTSPGGSSASSTLGSSYVKRRMSTNR